MNFNSIGSILQDYHFQDYLLETLKWRAYNRLNKIMSGRNARALANPEYKKNNWDLSQILITTIGNIPAETSKFTNRIFLNK